ncbi:MAG: hypothetical protein E7442_08810 [Ruminococcaceae bacterium]|nr:hypothetical protein [Oscillospiraceae bacterium]
MRDKRMDVLKGFGILLVVLGHMKPPFEGWIYAFHMPLFFFISGYLRYGGVKRSWGRVISRRAKSTLIPYLAFWLLSLAKDTVKLVLLGGTYKAALPQMLLGLLLGGGPMDRTSQNFPIWYLHSFFFISLLFEALLRTLKPRGLWLSGLLLALITLPFQRLLPGRPAFHINVFPPALVFMLLGYGFRSVTLSGRLPERLTQGLLPGAALILLGSLVSRPYGTDISNICRLTYFPGALLSILGFYAVSCAAVNWRLPAYLGECSLYILGMHMLFKDPSQAVIRLLTGFLPFDAPLLRTFLAAGLILCICCLLKEFWGLVKTKLQK